MNVVDRSAIETETRSYIHQRSTSAGFQATVRAAVTSASRFDRGAINDFLDSHFSLLRVASPLRFLSDSAVGQNYKHYRGETAMLKTLTIRSAMRRCLTVAVVGVLTVATLQDASAQMCQGGGGGRMGGGRGGRGGMMGGGQGGGGAAGMMQMMQMAQQAQAMQQQQMRQQLMAGQQQNTTTPATRTGRQFSEARRNRFRRSRTADASRTALASRTQRATEAEQVSRVSEASSSVSLPALPGPRNTSASLRPVSATAARGVLEYVVRLNNRFGS